MAAVEMASVIKIMMIATSCAKSLANSFIFPLPKTVRFLPCCQLLAMFMPARDKVKGDNSKEANPSAKNEFRLTFDYREGRCEIGTI